jgi:hypothetical protein
MDVTGRTLLRVFLVVGGIAILVLGIVSDDPFQAGLGAVATALGAFGLWWELTH